jgi:hypothetical protein
MEKKKINETHELVLLTHLKTELEYSDYGNLNLRNLEPLKSEVQDRISKLVNKDKQDA